jgi:hypothetical protein
MSALNVLASAIGDVIPLQAYRRIIPRELVGFVYHLVCERAGPHIRHLYSSKTPEMFEQDLLYLRENFALPGYDELFGNVRSTPGNRAAFVTFDDGLAECSSTVGPMLAKHHRLHRQSAHDVPPQGVALHRQDLGAASISANLKESLMGFHIRVRSRNEARSGSRCPVIQGEGQRKNRSPL